MRKSNHLREGYRQAVATAGAVLALAITACGTNVAGAPIPTPTPITADSIRAAFNNSTMNSAHFRLSGTLVMKPAYYTVTGDGVLQRVPREALQLNFRAQTFSSAGVLKITEVIIGGKLYTRVGAGKWTTRLTSESPTTPTSYVGEETISGTAVWHARSAAASHNAYDIWIRESDGYVVKLSYTGTSGTFTMTFDSYNKSPVITHP